MERGRGRCYVVEQFANAQAGTLRMELMYSEDSNTWYTINHFEILSAEVQARYVKYKIYLTDIDSNSYIYVKPVTHKAWYWQ